MKIIFTNIIFDNFYKTVMPFYGQSSFMIYLWLYMYFQKFENFSKFKIPSLGIKYSRTLKDITHTWEVMYLKYQSESQEIKKIHEIN
jgi:hypothetical protein